MARKVYERQIGVIFIPYKVKGHIGPLLITVFFNFVLPVDLGSGGMFATFVSSLFSVRTTGIQPKTNVNCQRFFFLYLCICSLPNFNS